MIEVEAVTKSYGAFTAVEDLSFSVAQGEILGFLGPNGAGKTTTMRVLTGFFPPSSGRVRVAGHDIVEEPLDAKAKIGYLPETPPLYPEMTVEDYLDFVARIKTRGLSEKERSKRVERALGRSALEDVRHKLTGRLSKGYRQRVGLAQALVHEPEVLVLDEPTAGLDPKQINETRELIKTLGGGHTVILSTHILSEVSMTCDRVVIINGGRLVAHGTPESLTEQFRTKTVLEVTVQGEEEAILGTLRGVHGVAGVELRARSANDTFSFRVELREGAEVRRAVAEHLVSRGFGLLELHQAGMSLEEVYLRAISRETGAT